MPSTTSITTQPTILLSFYLFVNKSTIRHATEPPIERPITMTFFYGKFVITYFNTCIVYVTIVSIEKSSRFYVFLEYPCPLKSNATTVPKFFISFAKVAKLSAECPAP